MGSAVRITLYAPDDETAFRAASDAFDRILALEAVMSDYRADSELSRFCARGETTGEPVPISEDLFDVLSRAQRLSELSDGAFDVTIGPLTRLWREARAQQRLPDAGALADALARTGRHRLILDERSRTARFTTTGARLDLGGIGKGYAADAAAQILERHDIDSYLIDVGGDLLAGDAPPGRDAWTIIVETPASAQPVALAGKAVATSGDTERFIELGGVRYSHILDPRTGLGLTTRLHVTVIADSATDADALASAISVLAGRGDPVQPLLAHFPRASVRIVDHEGRTLLRHGPGTPASSRPPSSSSSSSSRLLSPLTQH